MTCAKRIQVTATNANARRQLSLAVLRNQSWKESDRSRLLLPGAFLVPVGPHLLPALVLIDFRFATFLE
jgi:hypothetical protein